MKKIIIIMIVLSFGLNSSINSQKKVALTSFWVSKHIGFEQIGGSASLVAAIASLSEDPNFNLQPVLDNFYKTFTEDYSENFPFELMSEEDVIKRPEYIAYEGRFNEDKDADQVSCSSVI